jgi:hypothetical protein
MSSLNATYDREGWANILELIPLCEKVKKLSAICKGCHFEADFHFRFDHTNGSQFIGGAEMYMPLCRVCHNQRSEEQRCAKLIQSSMQNTDTMTSASSRKDCQDLSDKKLSEFDFQQGETSNSPHLSIVSDTA